MLWLDLLFGRFLEDNCFNCLCYRYSVTKDGMFIASGVQQLSDIISVSCSQLTQDFFFKYMVSIFFILTECSGALRNLHRILI